MTYAVDLHPDGSLVFRRAFRTRTMTVHDVTAIAFKPFDVKEALRESSSGPGFDLRFTKGHRRIANNRSATELVDAILMHNPSIALTGYERPAR